MFNSAQTLQLTYLSLILSLKRKRKCLISVHTLLKVQIDVWSSLLNFKPRMLNSFSLKVTGTFTLMKLVFLTYLWYWIFNEARCFPLKIEMSKPHLWKSSVSSYSFFHYRTFKYWTCLGISIVHQSFKYSEFLRVKTTTY